MSKKKKTEQLGMNPSTAQNRLKKDILFSLIKKLDLHLCYQCKKKINSVEELSIEHKVPWLDSDNPKELFFDLDNIAFSHLKCNISAARKATHAHPSRKAYEVHGCRCDECKEIQKLRRRKQRS